MRIKDIIFLIFCALFTLSIVVASQYKAKAERSELALQQLQATYDENLKMLAQYQRKMSSLTKALNAVAVQAEQRKQALDEVLNNEQNQKWRDGAVPYDVIRMFNERATKNKGQTTLSSNNGMPNN